MPDLPECFSLSTAPQHFHQETTLATNLIGVYKMIRKPYPKTPDIFLRETILLRVRVVIKYCYPPRFLIT